MNSNRGESPGTRAHSSPHPAPLAELQRRDGGHWGPVPGDSQAESKGVSPEGRRHDHAEHVATAPARRGLERPDRADRHDRVDAALVELVQLLDRPGSTVHREGGRSSPCGAPASRGGLPARRGDPHGGPPEDGQPAEGSGGAAVRSALRYRTPHQAATRCWPLTDHRERASTSIGGVPR